LPADISVALVVVVQPGSTAERYVKGAVDEFVVAGSAAAVFVVVLEFDMPVGVTAVVALADLCVGIPVELPVDDIVLGDNAGSAVIQ
jgi:hypothetical protein